MFRLSPNDDWTRNFGGFRKVMMGCVIAVAGFAFADAALAQSGGHTDGSDSHSDDTEHSHDDSDSSHGSGGQGRGGSGGGHDDGGHDDGHDDGGHDDDGHDDGGHDDDGHDDGGHDDGDHASGGKRGPRAGREDEVPQTGLEIQGQGQQTVAPVDVDLGQLKIARSPKRVLDRAYLQALSNFTADKVAFYNMSVEEASVALRNKPHSVSMLRSPLQNLALLRDVLEDGRSVLNTLNQVENDDQTLAAMFLGTASDGKTTITKNTVHAVSAMFGRRLSDAQATALASDAEVIRIAIAGGSS